MSDSDKSRTPRHYPGHTERKHNYIRMMRRLTDAAIRQGIEPPVKLPGFASRSFCCGYHTSDWRY